MTLVETSRCDKKNQGPTASPSLPVSAQRFFFSVSVSSACGSPCYLQSLAQSLHEFEIHHCTTEEKEMMCACCATNFQMFLAHVPAESFFPLLPLVRLTTQQHNNNNNSEALRREEPPSLRSESCAFEQRDAFPASPPSVSLNQSRKGRGGGGGGGGDHTFFLKADKTKGRAQDETRESTRTGLLAQENISFPITPTTDHRHPPSLATSSPPFAALSLLGIILDKATICRHILSCGRF